MFAGIFNLQNYIYLDMEGDKTESNGLKSERSREIFFLAQIFNCIIFLKLVVTKSSFMRVIVALLITLQQFFHFCLSSVVLRSCSLQVDFRSFVWLCCMQSNLTNCQYFYYDVQNVVWVGNLFFSSKKKKKKNLMNEGVGNVEWQELYRTVIFHYGGLRSQIRHWFQLKEKTQ